MSFVPVDREAVDHVEGLAGFAANGGDDLDLVAAVAQVGQQLCQQHLDPADCGVVLVRDDEDAHGAIVGGPREHEIAEFP